MTDQLPASPEAIEEFRTLMSDPAARQAFVEAKARHAESGARRRYEHVMAFVGEVPWAIRPSVLAVIVDILSFRVAGGRFTPAEIDARVSQAQTERDTVVSEPAGVAVIPLHGVIIPRADEFAEMSGATSVSSLRRSLRVALATPEVGAIVLDVDSPGGAVSQIPEIADEIYDARGQKPIFAVANTMAASGAYWIASQVDEFYVSKSGLVGSIGVITAHDDLSAAMEMEGIRTTLISAGKYKDEGNPFEALGDEARAHIQSQVDEFYGMFVKAVARGRGTTAKAVRSGFGQGRVFGITDAQAEGMVDGVASLEEVVKKAMRASRRQSNAAAAAGPTHVPDETAAIPLIGADVDAVATITDATAGAAAPAPTADEELAERVAAAEDDDAPIPEPEAEAPAEEVDDLADAKQAVADPDDEDDDEPAEDAPASDDDPSDLEGQVEDAELESQLDAVSEDDSD